MHLVFNAQKKNYSVNMKAAALASLFGAYICIFFMVARAAPRSNPEFARSSEDETQVSICNHGNQLSLAVFEAFHYLYRVHNIGLALHVLGTRIVDWSTYLSLKSNSMMKCLASDQNRMLLFSWQSTKGIVAKVSRTLLRRFWHKHFASHLQQVLEESMLLDEIVGGQHTLILVNVYVPANSYMFKTVRQLMIHGAASLLFMCTLDARLH